ncbi:hypothetical protein MKW92_015986 [Papaver armeniacum]|nr:hypothetical protein MKW92_015986 [Papaver armeniacum]
MIQRKEILRRCPEFRIRLQKIGCNWNLIHLASEYGYVELVKALVTKDASICSSLDLSNKSPLDYAAMSWRTQVIHELLSPKLLLQNALCIALGKRQREAFRVLAMKYMEDWVHQYDRIKAAKMDAKARLLMCVIQMGYFEGYKDLVDRCPLILDYVTAFPFGGTPLHIAIKAGKGKLTEFVKDIIRRKPQFARELDHKGHTPLDIASIHGYLDIVKELLGQVGPHLCSLHAGRHILKDDDADEYHIENILDTYINTKMLVDKDDEADQGRRHIFMKDDALYYGKTNSITHAIYHERISVINELLPIWWKSSGVVIKARDVSLFQYEEN